MQIKVKIEIIEYNLIKNINKNCNSIIKDYKIIYKIMLIVL